MAKNRRGKFTFILHSHLPYVLSHGNWPHGTDWLNEAAAETYIPILRKGADEFISETRTAGLRKPTTYCRVSRSAPRRSEPDLQESDISL